MSYYLSKLLPVFIYPLGLAVLLCLFAAMLIWRGCRYGAFLSVLMAATLLWISSTSVFADFLMGTLEASFPPIAMKDLPKAESIVILGGMTRGVISETGKADLAGSVDRLFYGASLYKAGKSNRVILAGGSANGFPSEAELMAEIIEALGVSKKHILLESHSRNTYQNAKNTVELLQKYKITRIILVTSAYHMRRAVNTFEAFDIDVIPAATDFQVVERKESIINWLPSAEALHRATKGIKEYIGWWVYSIRGWV